MAFLRAGLDAIGGLCGRLFESRCPVCLAPAPRARSQTGGGLCPACAEEMACRMESACPGCGLMREAGRAECLPGGLCADCRRTPPPWDAVVARAPYAGRLKEAIARLKFARELELTRCLGGLLADACARQPGCAAPDIVVAVPMRPGRLNERGFNQSVELARVVARRLGVPLVLDGLIRQRDDPPQARLERARRLVNLRGAFRGAPERLSGKRVLIVDDVMTTGATLRECALAVRAAGADHVAVATLARA